MADVMDYTNPDEKNSKDGMLADIVDSDYLKEKHNESSDESENKDK